MLNSFLEYYLCTLASQHMQILESSTHEPPDSNRVLCIGKDRGLNGQVCPLGSGDTWYRISSHRLIAAGGMSPPYMLLMCIEQPFKQQFWQQKKGGKKISPLWHLYPPAAPCFCQVLRLRCALPASKHRQPHLCCSALPAARAKAAAWKVDEGQEPKVSPSSMPVQLPQAAPGAHAPLAIVTVLGKV